MACSEFSAEKCILYSKILNGDKKDYGYLNRLLEFKTKFYAHFGMNFV